MNVLPDELDALQPARDGADSEENVLLLLLAALRIASGVMAYVYHWAGFEATACIFTRGRP